MAGAAQHSVDRQPVAAAQFLQRAGRLHLAALERLHQRPVRLRESGARRKVGGRNGHGGTLPGRRDEKKSETPAAPFRERGWQALSRTRRKQNSRTPQRMKIHHAILTASLALALPDTTLHAETFPIFGDTAGS